MRKFAIAILFALWPCLALGQSTPPSNAYFVFDTARSDYYPKAGLVAQWDVLDALAEKDIQQIPYVPFTYGDFEYWYSPAPGPPPLALCLGGACSTCPTGFACCCNVATDVAAEASKIYKSFTSVTLIDSAPAPGTSPMIGSLPYTLPAGSAYQATWWGKLDAGPGAWLALVAYADDATFYDPTTDTWIGGVSGQVSVPTASWTRGSMYINVGAADKNVTFYLYDVIGGNTVIVDNLQIRKLRNTGPYTKIYAPDGSWTPLAMTVMGEPIFSQSTRGMMQFGSAPPSYWGTIFDVAMPPYNHFLEDVGAFSPWADPVTDFSVGCYHVIRDNAGAASGIIAKDDGGANRSWYIDADAAGDVTFGITAAAGNSSATVVGGLPVTLDRANNVLGTYDFIGEGTSVLTTYSTNAAAVSTAVAHGPVLASAADVMIGYTRGLNYMYGYIGRCAFWNRALPLVEAKAWTYPHFPANDYNLTTYIKFCTQAASYAVCSADYCREAGANACPVEGTGSYAAFTGSTERLVNNSFENFAGDDSLPAVTDWTPTTIGSPALTMYRDDVKHGAVSLRVVLPDAISGVVLDSACMTKIAWDTYFYVAAKNLAKTWISMFGGSADAFSAKLKLSIIEYTGPVCGAGTLITPLTPYQDVDAHWQTIGARWPVASWRPTTGSFRLRIENAPPVAYSDILLDTASVKFTKYHTPWVHAPAVATAYNARSLTVDNPLFQTLPDGVTKAYEHGFCMGGWIWSDWGGSIVSPSAGPLFAIGPTANNWFYIYMSAAPAPTHFLFEVNGGIANKKETITINLSDTNWSPHNWHYLEACWNNIATPVAHHYNAKNKTWYTWNIRTATGSAVMNDTSFQLYLGHYAGAQQFDSYIYRPFIVPYTAGYSNSMFEGGKVPPLPYGPFTTY